MQNSHPILNTYNKCIKAVTASVFILMIIWFSGVAAVSFEKQKDGDLISDSMPEEVGTLEGHPELLD